MAQRRNVYAEIRRGGISSIVCVPDGGFPPFYEVRGGAAEARPVDAKEVLFNRKGRVAFFAKDSARTPARLVTRDAANPG